MTSNPPSTDTVDYVVYMPYSERATANPISVKAGMKVKQLIDAIYKDNLFKADIGTEKIYLYACGELPTEPSDGDDPRAECYKGVIEWLALNDNRKFKWMNPIKRLTQYHHIPAPEDNEAIDVIVVTDSILNSVSAKDQEPELPRLGSGFKPLRDLVSFEYDDDVQNIKWERAVELNEFDRDADIPPFVKDIVDRPRAAPNDESKSLLTNIATFLSQVPRDEDGMDRFSELFSSLFCETGTAEPYVAWNLEPTHFAFAAGTTVLPQERSPLREHSVHNFVLNWFEAFWLKVVHNSACTYDQAIPFPIVISLRNEKRKWTPRPDATFLERKIPRFLVEIDSHSRGQDKHRLNVYAACVLRLLARLKGVGGPSKGEGGPSTVGGGPSKGKAGPSTGEGGLSKGKGVPSKGKGGPSKGKGGPSKEEIELSDKFDKNVFLMAAYFSDSWVVNRYFFFLDEEDKVCRNLRTFDMKDPFQLTHFLREFYNYAFHVELGSDKSKAAPDMSKISERIAGSIRKSLHTKDLFSNSNSKGGGDSKQHGYGTRSSSKQQGDVDIQTAMVDGLRGSDYKVEEHPEEFGPLIDYPDHIMEARDSNQNRLIVKLVRKSSHERSLLEELSKQKSPLNHAVPLLDTIMSCIGPLLILERGNSLRILWNVDQDKAERWSRELMEGVAFLHRQKIAHLDIKPDNMICTFEAERLLIIDFDIAMRCKSVDEMVERSCGTTGWSAPEIVLEDGKPLRAFSPIRADLWSTGMVLQFIADKGGNCGFGRLIKMLIDRDPRQRPLLHEVVDEESVSWTTTQLLRAFGCYQSDTENQGTMASVNKLKRPRHDVSIGKEEGLAPKIPLSRKPRVSAAHSDSSDSSSSSDFSEVSTLSEVSDYTKVDVQSGQPVRLFEKDDIHLNIAFEEESTSPDIVNT